MSLPVIAEPMTLLTDYALAAQAAVLAARLRGLARDPGCRVRGLWAAAFAATAVAALLGGSSHGFAPHLGAFTKDALWLATYGFIGLANLLLVAGGVVASASGRVVAALLAAAVLRFLAYGALLASRREFRFVVYDYAVTLLVVLVVALLPHAARAGARGWLAAGVGVSFAGALVQRSGFALHAHFNHNDLFHVVQMVGLYLFYRGGARLQDARKPLRP